MNLIIFYISGGWVHLWWYTHFPYIHRDTLEVVGYHDDSLDLTRCPHLYLITSSCRRHPLWRRLPNRLQMKHLNVHSPSLISLSLSLSLSFLFTVSLYTDDCLKLKPSPPPLVSPANLNSKWRLRVLIRIRQRAVQSGPAQAFWPSQSTDTLIMSSECGLLTDLSTRIISIAFLWWPQLDDWIIIISFPKKTNKKNSRSYLPVWRLQMCGFVRHQLHLNFDSHRGIKPLLPLCHAHISRLWNHFQCLSAELISTPALHCTFTHPNTHRQTVCVCVCWSKVLSVVWRPGRAW